MEIINKFKKSEKGSITMMVLTTMLFMLVVITASYFAIANESVGQNKKITEISKRYQVSNDDMEQEFNEVLNKSEFLDINQVQNITMFEKINNTETEDIYGNKIIIPAGFKMTEDTTNVADGIVIEDKEGNQFVWVPVGDIYTDTEKTETNKKTINLRRYDFVKNDDGTVTTSEYTGTYTEDTSNNHNSNYLNKIAKNIEEFVGSANNNGGYYIGRYEAGVKDYNEIESTENSNSENEWTAYTGDNIKLVSKRGQQVWNYVTQNKASQLSKNMYQNNEFESDLINSYAWDTALVFIQEFSGDTDYALQARIQDSLTNTGETSNGTAYDVRCNIYDMAGNTVEWTTETTNNSTTYCCSHRGGSFWQSEFFAGKRSVGTTVDAYSDISFRPILYINN